MTERVLPTNLNYNLLKPQGYPSSIKQEKYTPISFNQASMSDIIRFNISTDGFWDPYSAYIKLEVDTFGMDPVGLQVLDNSAHSFISQLIITQQGTEIERIEEYDTLAAILVDMNYSPESRSSRRFEGISAITGITNNPSYCNLLQNINDSSYGGVTATAVNQNTIGFIPNAVQELGGTISIQQSLGIIQSIKGIGSITSYAKRYETNVLQYSSQTIDRALDNDLTGSNAIYKNTITSFEPQKNTSDNTLGIGKYGYRQPFNYSLSSCSNEEFLTPNYISKVTYKGLLGRQAYKQKATFCIPILSGLLGILMPRDSYRYIPMKALQNLILEFRLNPYAMFSSGYQDTGVTTDVSTVNQIRRFWKITKFELNVEMQYFESNVTNIILNQLNSVTGIVLHSSSWQLGPRYSIPANTSPNGVYQVNLQFESLRNVLWLYLPDDWSTYNYCRKQFRINHNISQYYVKIGQLYYPNLPITGHAGNALTYGNIASSTTQTNSTGDTDSNNSEFLIQLYKCFGKYQDISTDAFIDPVNFAVNERCYNPAAVGALASGTEYVNIHTAGGLPLFHETRNVGKAVYALNLEQLNNDFSVISGTNTLNNKTFEINIKSDIVGTSSFTRPSTMYVFCQFDMLIQLKYTGVQVLGRG